MRKTAIITISAEGRDSGKVFVLKEMPATKAEKWAVRAFFALNRAGIEIPEDIVQMGLAGIAMIGFKMLGSVQFEDAEPLLDEIMGCVSIMPDPKRPDVVRPLVDRGTDGDDIEEVPTRFHLRMEVFTLHTGFTFADVRSKLTSAPATVTG